MSVINANSLPTGKLEGAEDGATISLSLDHPDSGQGPRLHKHRYDEAWVVIDGNLTFQAGDQQREAGTRDIVIVPPDTPHKFTNCGSEHASLVCIHASPTIETESLE